MRLLLVLLACIAAANAYCGSYSYYTQKNFCVYPSAKVYRYTIYFPSIWCSSSYYSPIVKVYPGEDCGKDGWEERDINDIITEMTNLLKSALLKMQQTLAAKRAEWIKQIDACHAEYKATYIKYITKYYAYRSQCNPGVNYEAEKQAKITAYCKKLAEKRAEMIAKYDAAVAAKVKSVVEYHAKLIKSARECLETRAKKIAEYKATSAKKIQEYTVNFAKYHLALAKKNKDQYKAALAKLFSGGATNWWLGFKAYLVVELYYREQRQKIENLTRVYVYKLGLNQKKLVDYYTCAYRCYLSNACLRFYKKSYYSQCKSLGNWHTYKTGYCYRSYYLSPYCVRYCIPTYKNLKTCDVNEDAKHLEKVIADLIKKRDAALAEHTRKYNEWKSKWIGYAIQYKAKYAQYVKERHDWWLACVRDRYIACNRGAPLTPEQLAALAKLKKELEQKAAEACAKYYSNLITQIRACHAKYLKEQAAYKKMVDDLIAKIRANYTACSQKRTAAIAAYKKKLEDTTRANRLKILQKFVDGKNAHWQLYRKMMVTYHGENWSKIGIVYYMAHCYADQLVYKCNSEIAKYDAFWRDMIPKLVMHYSCGYRCRVYACSLPTYKCGTYYSWSFSLPKCSAYTYKYSSYYKCIS